MKQSNGPLLGLLTVLCWSAYNVAAIHGIETGLSPHALSFLRFAVPGLVVLPLLVALHVRREAAGIPIRRLVVLILLGGPVFGLFAVSGYVHAPLSHGLLFAPVAVFVTGSVLGHLLLREHMSTGRATGAAIMFIGLASLVGLDVGGLGPTWPRGAALFVLAGTMWGTYTVLLRLWRIPIIEGSLTVASGSAIIAAPVLLVPASDTLLTASLPALALQIIMQGFVGGVLSVFALIGAVRALPVHVTALLPVFTPIVALGIASIVFGTTPKAAELLGALIIAAGFMISLGLLRRQTWSTSQTGTLSS